MKRAILHIIALLLWHFVPAQITSPVKRANFGLDAGLRANFFNGIIDTDDDWFRTVGSNGTGDFIIDTTGAAAIIAAYTTNPASRSAAFSRGMRFPLLSTINNRIYYDAAFIRDHRATDSTSFAGGSKNGQSPLNWATAVSPVLSKNDILDVMLHVRRDGASAADSLWFFGAVSVQSTNGDRYFDFELYQTNIRFNRATGSFENVGPDAGHTSWQFNTSGHPTRLGDIIFTAEYSNSGLRLVEARIWVPRSALTSVNPSAFDWSGSFDGDGNNAAFGYAGILPNDAGTFYQGMQNPQSTWAGPFGTINTAGSISTDYTAIQLMEFSVNLTKLGLDPMNFSGGSICNLAFSNVLVKSRTSSSFTSNMTDFVLPFSFSVQPSVAVTSNFPLLCPSQPISNLRVVDPLSTSTYFWTSPDGSFASPTTGTEVQINGPGTYIVHQEMLTGCGISATDTIRILYSSGGCFALPLQLQRFTATGSADGVVLQGEIAGISYAKSLVLERSTAGNFESITTIPPLGGTADFFRFQYNDRQASNESVVLYRLRIVAVNGTIQYSPVVQVRNTQAATLRFTVAPNPLDRGRARLQVHAMQAGSAEVRVLHSSGQLLHHQVLQLQPGEQQFWLPDAIAWPKGNAFVQLRQGKTIITRQVIIGTQ